MASTPSPTRHSGQILFAAHGKKYKHLPLALDGLGIDHLQEHVDRPIGISCWQWIQVISGTGILMLNSKSYPLEPGCGILLPPSHPHIYHGTGADWHTNFLCYDGAAADDIMRLLDFDTPGVYQLSNPQRILDYEDEICDLYLQDPVDSSMEISKILYALLLDVSRDAKASLERPSHPQNHRIHEAICFMQAHYKEPIGLSDIASHVGLSREYLCHIFKKVTNSTILEHLTQIRITEAKIALLKFPDKPIREIAQLCGFDSPSYFCSQFKKHEHMTPLQFGQSQIL